MCREMLSEEIKFDFTYNRSFDAKFSILETFDFLLSLHFINQNSFSERKHHIKLIISKNKETTLLRCSLNR